jgi:uncharacterized protein (TIGR04255 family)
MDWEPAHADHSIDRAVVTLNWRQPIDANTFDEMIVAGRKAAAAHHLTNRVDLQDAFELPPGGGMIALGGNFAPPRRVAFQRLDQAKTAVEEFSIGMQRITFFTQRYRRWENLRQIMVEVIGSLEPISPIMQNVKTARVEYIDRFQSKPGGADHFEVIEKTSDHITPKLREKGAALHVHSGWFDYEPPIRRLTNVNIDVNDLSMPVPENRRNLTVLTLGQFEALEGVLQDPTSQIDVLHDYLKGIFRATITKEAAVRVSLGD